MRTLLVLLVGIAIGAFGLYFYQQQPTGTTGTATSTTATSNSVHDAAERAAAKTKAVASDVSDAFAAKMRDWHLTPPEIRQDLAHSGQVVRDNTARFRETVTDARIEAVIKAKYVLEKDLPANAIIVDSVEGKVTLTGALASEALVAKAVALALDTAGVQHVTSRVTVSP